MNAKELFFRSFQRIVAPLPVRHFKKIPGVARLYTAIYRRLKPHGIREVTANGHTMLVHLHDEGIARQILLKGTYEEEETALVAELLSPGMAVLDIGANFGWFTLACARAVGERGTVWAFEPEPANFALLTENVAKNGYTGRARPMQLALSNEKGTMRLFLDPANLGNPSLASANIASSSGHVDVPTERLDDLARRERDAGRAPARFDFLKMDVQGAEGLVLEGAKELLAKDRPRMLLEVWPKGLRNLGTDPRVFLEGLEAAGYELRRATRATHASPRARLTVDDVLRICETREDGEDFVNVLFEPR